MCPALWRSFTSLGLSIRLILTGGAITDLMEKTSPQDIALQLLDTWVRTEKTTMPKKELFKGMIQADIGESTARKAISSLIKKGFIRRDTSRISNQTFYVQIKSISRY
jgi:hypothetical protein